MGSRKKIFGEISLCLLLAACGGSSSVTDNVSVSTETSGGGNSTSSAPTSVGDIETLSFNNSSTTITFPSTSGNTSYLLILNSNTQQGGSTSLQISRSGSDGFASLDVEPQMISEKSEEDSNTPPEQFHEYLREVESNFKESSDYKPLSTQSSLSALSTLPEVGSSTSFRVLSSISSISNYTTVPATLRKTTDNLLLYTETEYQDQISDEELAQLAEGFEAAIPTERNLFGYESDLNFDGHITILFTCNLNKMSVAYGGGNFTGFFFIGDLYQENEYNPASNNQEIFYVMMPDPDGRCGNPISNSFTVNNILPGVLTHEFQHMISAFQHVFVQQGSVEEPWLNEALSHFAEDITGYGNENPSRIRQFFNQPSAVSLVTGSSPNLAERGAGYLFVRYLYEQSSDGNTFIHNLYSSNKTGIRNLEGSFNGTDPTFTTFSDFVNRWSITLALSETGWTSDSRYNYQARTPHALTGELTGICIRCDAQDGRGTILSGPVTTGLSSFPSSLSIKNTSSGFYELTNPRGTINISGSASAVGGALIQLR